MDNNGQLLTMPIRHAGQYFDSEVGVFYNYFRDYDPATGRYVQSDPIGLDGGLNTYGYVGGNPLGSIDPFGLSATTANPPWDLPRIPLPSPQACFAAGARLLGAAAGLVVPSSMGCDPVVECPENNCTQIYRDINKAITTVERRYNDLKQDPLDLYNRRRTGEFSYEGHRSWYRKDREKLANLVRQAIAMKCLDYNHEADYWISKEPPSRPSRR